MLSAEEKIANEGSSSAPRRGHGATDGARACDRALGALALTRARLAWLESRCTSEQLPAGHWLLISPENLLVRLTELADHVHAVLQGLRGALRDPRPSPEWDLDLVARLRALSRQFLADTGIHCELAVDAEPGPLGARACEVVYWAVCELLTNVRKHACATKVTISSGTLDGGFTYVRVEDDGVGMRRPVSATGFEGRGLGLWNVEQHLNGLGGSVEIESNRGLTVTMLLPRT